MVQLCQKAESLIIDRQFFISVFSIYCKHRFIIPFLSSKVRRSQNKLISTLRRKYPTKQISPSIPIICKYKNFIPWNWQYGAKDEGLKNSASLFETQSLRTSQFPRGRRTDPWRRAVGEAGERGVRPQRVTCRRTAVPSPPPWLTFLSCLYRTGP